MRKNILIGLALLVVGLLGISVTVLAVNAQSNGERSMMGGNIEHNDCQNFSDTNGDGICDRQGSGGRHMGGMGGINMMQMHGNLTMQQAGNCERATATP